MLALLRLSALPGAQSAEAEAEEAKLQGAVAVNSFEDQIATNFFAGKEEEEEDDIKMKEIIERYSYGRVSGKSGKSIPSCTKRLLNDCYHVRRLNRRGYSLPSSVRSRGDSILFREICRDVCNVKIPRTFSVQSEKYRGSSSESNKSKDVIVRQSDKSDSDLFDVEGVSEMEPSKSKAWDDYDEDEDKMYIDSYGRDEDGDVDMKVLVLTITVEGHGRSRQSGRSSKRRSSVGGEWSNSRAMRGSCHSAFVGNRRVSRIFARRCANSFGYNMRSFLTIQPFDDEDEEEDTFYFYP